MKSSPLSSSSDQQMKNRLLKVHFGYVALILVLWIIGLVTNRFGDNDLLVQYVSFAATVSSLLVNVSLDPSASEPCLATLKIGGLAPGERLLSVYRIDDERRWDAGTLEMEPLETRRVFVRDQFECQLYLPADSVTLFTLSELAQAS